MESETNRAWFLPRLGAVVLAAVLCCTESSDPDLGFHLATGRAVLAARAIPSENVLTFAEPHHAWLDHSAPSSVLFELTYRAGGFLGTRILLLSTIVAIALFVLGAARRLGARPLVAFFMCALGMWAAAFRFVERPLIFSNLVLAIVLWAGAISWERLLKGETLRARAPLVGAGLAIAVGAQLHAGTIFAVAIMTGLSLALAAETQTHRYKSPIAPAESLKRSALAVFLAAAGGVTLGAALLATYHPFGASVLATPFRIGFDSYLLEHIVEFRTAYSLPVRLLGPYWLFLGVAIVVVVTSVKRVPLPFFVPLVVGFALSLRHGRFADIAWITAVPPLAAMASQQIAKWKWEGALAIVALIACFDRSQVAPTALGPSPAVWPTPLFEAIEKTNLQGPSFVQDGWAGPFLARFWPRERVFFHPVFEAYSPEHVALYQKVRYGEPVWKETLDKFDIQFVLMKHTSERERQFQQGKPNLRQHLAVSAAWGLLAFDEYGALWARRDGKNAEALGDAPSFVDPDVAKFVKTPKLARQGLETMWKRGPESVRLALMLVVARADDGDINGAIELLEATERSAPGDPRILATRAMFVKR